MKQITPLPLLKTPSFYALPESLSGEIMLLQATKQTKTDLPDVQTGALAEVNDPKGWDEAWFANYE